MSRKAMIKKWCSLLCVIFVAVPLFAQTELTNLNTKWSIVLTGKALCKPEKTPYGMICVTDARTISSISNNGVTLWEKPITGISSPIVKTIYDEFIVTVTYDNERITLLNPSGIGLWTKTLMWKVTENPYQGRDGRFFLRGSEHLCCFGINGVCKWEIETEKQSKIPLQELPDGSLVVFLEKLSDGENGGKTRALRMSPFGKIVEEITLSGEVVNSATCSEGVLLNFADGNAALLSIGTSRASTSKAINKWSLKSDALHFQNDKNNLFIANKEMSDCYFLTSKDGYTKAFKIDSMSGKVKSEFDVPNIALDDICDFDVSSSGLLILDTKNGCYFTQEDKLIWEAKLPDKKKTRWNNTFFTSNNQLIFTYDDWSIDAYFVTQNVEKKGKSAPKKPTYSSYYNIDTSLYETVYKYSFNPNLISDERIMSLQAGYYGNNEIGYTSELQSALKAYQEQKNRINRGTRVEKNVFETNTSGIEKLYSQLPYFGTMEFASLTANMIKTETNSSLLNTALIGIQKNGYDPEGEILTAIQNLVDSTSKINTTLGNNICDAVYSICRFMGRPAFNKNGKKILTKMLATKSKPKAQETLKALSKLEF